MAGLGVRGWDKWGGPSKAGKMLRKGKRDKGTGGVPPHMKGVWGLCAGPPRCRAGWGGCAVDATGIGPGEVSGPASAALPRGRFAWAAPMQGMTAARECPSGWGSAHGRPASCRCLLRRLWDFILGSSYWMLWGCSPLCPRPRPGLSTRGLPHTSYPKHTQWKRPQKMGQEILRFM